MKLVIDTNCLLVSIPKRSQTRWLYDCIRLGKVDLGITNEILEEYEEVFGSFYSTSLASNVVELLINLRTSVWVTPYYKWNLIEQDPDDNKFADCAISCGADHIITHDKHFNILKTIYFPRVSVLTMEELKKILF